VTGVKGIVPSRPPLLYPPVPVRSLRLPWLLVIGATACAAEGPAPPVVPPPPPPALTVRPPDWGPAPAAAPPERRVAQIVVSPVTAGADVDHLEVSIRLSEPPGEFAEPEPLHLWLARSEDGEAGWAEAVEDLYAQDAEGALPLRVRDNPSLPSVEWRSDRRPVGAIRVDYHVHLTGADMAHLHGTRAYARGFEGSGATFLLLPDTGPADPYRVRLSWGLSHAGEGATGASTMGADALLPLGKVREAELMAGPLGRLAIDDDGSHFEGAWLGRLGTDPVEVLSWVARLRDAALILFHDWSRTSFSVLIRSAPGATWNFAQRTGGLRILAGEAEFGRAQRFQLGREVVRRWIGGEGGVRFAEPEPAARLLTEGLAEHFTRELLLRTGLATIDEVAEELRDPLPPSALYFAALDATLRDKSRGKRSLDDLVVDLLGKTHTGTRREEEPASTRPPLPTAALRELIGEALGPAGLQAYDAAVVRGEPVKPGPTAFGPCFVPEKKAGRAAKPGEAPGWARDPRQPAACARHSTK
jgi:hypothetical protein